MSYTEMNFGGGGSGASSADKVSYDNTQSGLTETNVQGAIDELASKNIFSTTETVIGLFDDGEKIRPLYRKVYRVSSSQTTVIINVDNTNLIYTNIYGTFKYPSPNYANPINYYYNDGSNTYNTALAVNPSDISIRRTANLAGYTEMIIIGEYYKTTD